MYQTLQHNHVRVRGSGLFRVYRVLQHRVRTLDAKQYRSWLQKKPSPPEQPDVRILKLQSILFLGAMLPTPNPTLLADANAATTVVKIVDNACGTSTAQSSSSSVSTQASLSSCCTTSAAGAVLCNYMM